MMSNKKSDEPMKINSFEDLLDLVGTNGWRNYFIFIMSSITCMIPAINVFSYQFLGGTPEHWCHVQELVNQNWTTQQIKEIAIPNGTKCEMYDLSYTNIAMRPYEEISEMVKTDEIQRLNKTYCHSRDFEDHPETIVNKWDLVCERRALYSTTQAAVQGGTLVGSFTVGFFVDRGYLLLKLGVMITMKSEVVHWPQYMALLKFTYVILAAYMSCQIFALWMNLKRFGRRFMYRICVWLGVIVLFLTSVSPNIYAFIAFRLISAILDFGFYMANFVLCMELASKNQRALVGSYTVIPWVFGMILTAGIAYYIRPWRQLQIALSIPCTILLFNCWFLPESPRWLILKRRYEETTIILKVIAKSNKKEIPSDEELIKCMDFINKMNADSAPSKEKLPIRSRILEELKEMFSTLLDKELRGQTLLLFYSWFAVSMVYYGVSLSSSTLSTNDYLYITLSGLIEIPCYLIPWPTVSFLGRRKALCFFYLTCALSIFSVMVLVITNDEDFQALRLVLFLGGKFGITAAYQLIWFYTAELYPTQLRSILVGQSSAVARVGSMSSPYINDLLGEKSKWSPAALFGGISLVAGLVSLTFRETSGENLPDSASSPLQKPLPKARTSNNPTIQQPSK